MKTIESAMIPAQVFSYPKELRFQDNFRRWQGIPSVAISPGGKLFVDFYGGQAAEVPGNIVILCESDDFGETFTSCVSVVEHPSAECRVFDPNIWTDPLGRMWMFWTQTKGSNDGRNGVWAAICQDPDAHRLVWEHPRRIANGIMMNKPIVASNGDWIFPCAIWRDQCGSPPQEDHGLSKEQYSNVYVSSDAGKTIKYRGSADVPDRQFDEHMVVETLDHRLWMLVRTFGGIGESFSNDFGQTWTPGQKSHIEGPCSRFFIGRLHSGRLLMINHYHFNQKNDRDSIMKQGHVKSWRGRNHLTALLSEDDGKTWPYSLLIDEREDAAYPDAAEGPDGMIYIVYDYKRVTQRKILMAKITEEDIIAGRLLNSKSKLRVLVNQCVGQPDVE